MTKWTKDRAEVLILLAIAARAMRLIREGERELLFDPPIDKMDIIMSIDATHANGNPLQLKELLAAPEVDFIHDVFGMIKHLNRCTGNLKDCFIPRYSETQVVLQEEEEVKVT